MRRILTGLVAFLALTATFVVLPVYAAPLPDAEPVTTATGEVAMGSVTAPAPAAEVQSGTTDPVAGVPATAPTLTVTRTGVEPFSLVGVTWAYDPAVTDTVVQVRVAGADGAWGGWTEVTPETADQGAARTGAELRGGTSPLWTGPSTGVDVELVTRTGAQPTDVQLDLVDPGSSPADTSLSTPDIRDTAHAAATMPAVYSRAQWGADERIRTWAPQYAATIKAATLHHTADSNNYTADDVPAIMRSIYRYHTVSLGWGDIGYNVIVDKFGRLWEGRYGGLASTVMGAHAGGFNTSTFGVSMLGNYDVAPVPQATVDAVSAIIAWKFSLYGVDPRGTTVLTSSGGGTSKYAAGTKVTLPTIFGHRDVGSTVCPGRYGYPRLDEIREMASGQVTTALLMVRSRYSTDAAARSLLGAETTPPTLTPDGSGAYAHYANGSIYASTASGAHVVRGAVRDKWAALGWERSWLGYPTSDVTSISGGAGSFAHFQRGSIYWSAPTGAHTIAGALLEKWGEQGWETGALGYPTTDQAALTTAGAQFVHFTNGSIYWSSATGAHIVFGVVRDRWAAAGWETGALGLPTSDVGVISGGSGRYAHFQNGSIYWSQATGARLLLSAIRDRWGLAGWENGSLGYPVTDQLATPGGAGQVVQFQGGWVYWSSATGARVLTGAVRDTWLARGGDRGSLGLPISDEGSTPDGNARAAHFSGGSIYVHKTLGAIVLPAAVRDGWAASGWEAGPLGYPTADATATPEGRGVVQVFQGGKVLASAATGGHAVPAALLTAYESVGASAGSLGFPTSDAGRTAGGAGRYQHFEGGSLYSSATGTWVVPADVRALWQASGWEIGPLGYPTAAAITSGGADGSSATAPGSTGALTYQAFQGGTVYVSASGGHIVPPAFGTAVAAAGGGSVLGVPTSDVVELPDGRGTAQVFTKGVVYASGATGPHAVTTELFAAYSAAGWERGVLGYPISDVGTIAAGNGRYQHFQGGSVYWSPATGAHVVRGPVRDAWAAQGWETGALGFPIGDLVTLPDGRGQATQFQGGTVYWTQATGAHAVDSRLLRAWASWGWERGVLGYPTTDTLTAPDGVGRFTVFQGGSVYWSPSTGAHVLGGVIRDAWGAVGWERGALGYPTTDLAATPDGKGLYVHFQGGSVYWSQRTGAHALRTVVRDAWADTGWEAGPLGYPTADTRAVSDGMRTDFEHGYISVSGATGKPTVTVR